jgi:ABC-type oligopeptide transport system substrate-binding subunit
VNIVGASDYNAGRTSTVTGIRTRGPHTLIIELVSPSPLLATLLALPPAGGVSTRLPFSAITSVNASNPLPTGGRYYVQEYRPDRFLAIRKNRFYKPLGAVPTPGVAAGFDYDIGVQQDQALLLMRQGQLDWAADGLPSTAWWALSRRGNDYDLAVVGWAALFPDPSGYVNTLPSGDTIRETRNTNTAYFNDPEANRLMRAAARLTGRKRLEAYGKLDLLIQERWAPLVVLGRRNDRAFFSARIDTKSIVQSPVYELDLGRLALR